MIILYIFNINYILLEISGSHSDIISDSCVFHYGNELVSRTGNKKIRHFVTTNCDQKYPFAPVVYFCCQPTILIHHTTYIMFMFNYIIQLSTTIKIVYKTSHTNISTSKIHNHECPNLRYNCLPIISRPFVTNNIQMHEKVYT